MDNTLVTPAILTSDHADSAKELLSLYYGLKGTRAYAGAAFEVIGADETNPFDITPADLLSLGTLSVPVEAYTVIGLSAPEFRFAARELLAKIPVDVSIGADDAMVHLAELRESPASQLWSLIRQIEGMGPVSTSKLLARKRPALIPVYDTVIDGELGLHGTDAMWSRFHEWVNRRENGTTPLEFAEQLGRDAGVPAYVTPLRVIDVVLWMNGKREGASA